MGCLFSSSRRFRSPGLDDDSDAVAMLVFWPGLRIPSAIQVFDGCKPEVPEQILSVRVRIQSSADALHGEITDDSSQSASQPAERTVTNLQQAFEEYLPLFLGWVKGSESTNRVKFTWKNKEDAEQETAISDEYYEVLSVLHSMAVLQLMRTNALLSLKTTKNDVSETITPVDRRKQAIDVFLKAAGLLECAVKVVIPRLSQESKENLPADLTKNVLDALSMQALGQCVEIQLGLAVDNMKASLAVKRRLACEQVKYWQKAHENIEQVQIGGGWGGKHRLYLSWKLAEAKAAAFYFHALILDEGIEEGTHAKAVLCLKTADTCLQESRKLCANFCIETPTTRTQPLWGAMKYLSEKIPRDYTSKMRTLKELYSQERMPDQVPELPDFPLSLIPDDFALPEVDRQLE